jgi:hypothetical protein
MVMTITDERMSSDRTPATAEWRPHAAPDGTGARAVSWLPERLPGQSQAVTAITLAERAASGISGSEPEDWLLAGGRAEEPGLFEGAELAGDRLRVLRGRTGSPSWGTQAASTASNLDACSCAALSANLPRPGGPCCCPCLLARRRRCGTLPPAGGKTSGGPRSARTPEHRATTSTVPRPLPIRRAR